MKPIEQLFKEAKELDVDPYEHIAKVYYGEVTPKTRRLAKEMSFCYLYGGGGGPTLTKEDIAAMGARLREKYHTLGTFHKPGPNVQPVKIKGTMTGRCPWSMSEEELAEHRKHAEFKKEWDCEWSPPKPQGTAADITPPGEDGLYPHQREMIERFTTYDDCPVMDVPDLGKTGPMAYVVDECAVYKPPKTQQAEDRMYRKGVTTFKVRVFQDSPDGDGVDYTVRACDSLDARCMAFLLDGGCETGMSDWDDGHIELAITWTRLIS